MFSCSGKEKLFPPLVILFQLTLQYDSVQPPRGHNPAKTVWHPSIYCLLRRHCSVGLEQSKESNEVSLLPVLVIVHGIAIAIFNFTIAERLSRRSVQLHIYS